MRGAALVAAMILALSGGASAAYDDTWYAAEFWNGEYPNGFSILEETTVKMRAETDRDAARTIDCVLPKGAVYHPWNAPRVASDALAFRSFTTRDVYAVNRPTTVTLVNEKDSTEKEVDFATGDTWTYLTYLAEGAFLMEYDGVTYLGDQDLIENSTSTSPNDSAYEEWLGLTCANGAKGWLFLPEVVVQPTIGAANIVTYGEAADLAP